MTEEKGKKKKAVSVETDKKIQQLKERSKEIAKGIPPTEKVKLTEIIDVEKDIQKAVEKKDVESLTTPPEKEKPPQEKKPPKSKKTPVKDIEKVEKELARTIEEEKQQKEAAKVYPFQEAIKQVKQSAKKRKFSQTWDLAISLKGVDLKKPENRFSFAFSLPAGRGKPSTVGVIADSLAEDANKKGADIVIRKDEIAPLRKDKKKLKKIANEIDWFFGEISLMAEIGKSFGVILGPRGKVPKPIPPKVDVGLFIKNARNSVRVSLKESPVIHVSLGTENMSEEDILKNLNGVYSFVKEKLAKGMNNIRNMHLKLTMGKPVKLEVK